MDLELPDRTVVSHICLDDTFLPYDASTLPAENELALCWSVSTKANQETLG